MRDFFTVLGRGLGISGVGLAMLLRSWHPEAGAFFIAVGLAYLLWELLSCGPVVRVVPEGMLRFIAGVMIAAFALLLVGPSVQQALDSAQAQDPTKRIEFLQRRGDPLRSVVFFVRLDRKYTPEELGHFHLVMEGISLDAQGSALIATAQDSYATWQDGAKSRLMFGTLHDAWIVDPDQDLQHTIIGGSAFDRDDFSSSWVDAWASIDHRGPFQTIGALDHAVLLFYASKSILPKLAYMGVSADDYLILGLPIGQLDTAGGKPSVWPKSMPEKQKADLEGVDWVQLVRKPYNPRGPSPPVTAIVPNFDRYTPVRLGELYQQEDWSSIVVPAK